ncbi:hypothetical protein K458DRAFT_486710 [Lentithecium fluviatile CBS 122367]|uniref:Uncharacterized protein n=1 Tax=Lentithecium fluviatile CBS 122367 TaxID=1168545 RepID=A0A6G1J4G0_9PLEO|nr:hypothetical protein K458DRAFT_486710 [Lentithecium fluviatile CBS 122367]
MSSTTNFPHPAIACAESISLLYLLHSVPTPPSSNRLDYLPLHQEVYTLSFTRERNLAGTLAFLSNTKDDPDHIPAVCVMEDLESSSLSILLAVNRGKPGDGNVVLQEIKRGFESIYAVLSQVSDRENTSKIESDVFTAIITMCSRRILCRLRFIPNIRKISKQPIKKVLQDAINCLGQLGNKGLGKLSQIAMLFAERAKEVIKLADSWAKHQTLTRLGDLVEGIYRLWKIGELQALLEAIPNRAMDPSARRNLFNIVSKVARYREAARFLYRTAKKFRSARQMKVLLAGLPEEAFHKVPADKYTPRLAPALMRMGAVYRQGELGHICRLLKTTEPQANDQFANQTRKALTKAKIHAEIQLLFYCEMNTPRPPPRVICSSKDACFLCNAFILMHGKMHMPRYHGRLYTGWRLPLFPKLNDTAQRFNAVLENQAKNSLKSLLSRQQKTIYPDPNESTLLTLTASASTLCGSALSEEIVEQKRKTIQAQIVMEDNPSIVPSTQAFPTSLGNIPGASSAIKTEDATTGGKEHMKTLLLNGTASQFPTRITADAGRDLIQGVMLSRTIVSGSKSRLFSAGPLEVQIEYTVENAVVSHSASEELGYSIEWLTGEEVERLQEYRAASFVDAEALQDDILHELDDQNCLFIAARETAIKILVHPRHA